MRGPARTLRRVLILVPSVAMLILFVGVPAARAVANCVVNPTAGTLAITTDGSGDILRVLVGQGEVLVFFDEAGPAAGSDPEVFMPCDNGPASLSFIRTITYADLSRLIVAPIPIGDSTTFVIDLTNGQFVNTLTQEEIKFNLNFGGTDVDDVLRITGSSGDEGIILGNGGGPFPSTGGQSINLNGDFDADVSIVGEGAPDTTLATDIFRDLGIATHDPIVVVNPGLGNDVVLASGGNGTGTGPLNLFMEINGAEGDDTLVGGNRDDTVLGGPGDDDLRGGPGFDTVDGGIECDQMTGDAGDDALRGGEPQVCDTLDYGRESGDAGVGADDPLVMPEGDNTSNADDTSDTNGDIDSVIGFEIIEGSIHDDDITGSGIDNIIRGNKGNDLLSGGEGNDLVVGDLGEDMVGDRVDTPEVDEEIGDDVLSGRNDADLILGGEGDDALRGGSKDDTLTGGLGEDRLSGGEGDDSLEGNDDRDILRGADGDDDFLGGEEDDFLFGGQGDDTMDGETGKDTVNGGAGDDDVVGGPGADLLLGLTGDDKLTGQDGPDTLRGGFDDDKLEAGDGNDDLAGGPKDDLHKCGKGNDRAVDNEGNNRFQGCERRE